MNTQTIVSQAGKHIGTVMNVVNVFKLLHDKFLPEYRQSQKTENISLDEALYSCIFDGEVQQETNKRNAMLLKQQCLETLEKFLNQLPYNQVFNSEYIMELNQGNIIDFNNILANLQYLTHRPQSPEIMILNEQLNEVGNICLDYFIQSFKQAQLENELVFQLEDFRDKIFSKIRKIAKSKAGNTYAELEKFVAQYIKAESKTPRFNFLDERQNDLSCLKQIISKQFEQFEKEVLDNLESHYKFHLNNIILSKYYAKIYGTYLSQIKNSLRIYDILQDANHNYYLHSMPQKLYLDYLKTGQLQRSELKNINQELQDLILSQQWNKQSSQMEYALQVLQYLRSQLRQSINVQLEEFDQIKLQKSRIQQSQTRLNNLHELQVINIIFELYLHISQIRINASGYLELGQYRADKRLILTQLVRYFSNLKFGYPNIRILNIFESITGQLYQKILSNRVWKDKFDLKFNEEQITIKMQEPQFNNLRQNHRLAMLLDMNFENSDQYHATIQSSQKQYISEMLNEAHLKYLPLLTPPKYFFFERISPPEHRSTIVNLCISGLTSENEDKQENWKDLIREDGPVVYALHWESSSIKAFALDLGGKAAAAFIATGTSGLGLLLASLGALTNNPYTEAEKEASLVGQYLGVLIGQLRIFGDSQVNLISFSLGTQVSLQCIKQLDTIYEKNKFQLINEVMLMGGVAECNELSRLRWHCVAGNIYNVYSKKDYIIRYLLKVMKLLSTPCGKTKVNLGYRKVINCDLSSIIDGHNLFKKKLADILIQTDFDNDYKVIYSD